MRKINDLMRDDMRVWCYLGSNRAKELFAVELARLGARYKNGDPVKCCSDIMAFHPDLTVTHVSWMVWDASFMPSFPERYAGDASKILRVDYERYINGASDYLIEKRAVVPLR